MLSRVEILQSLLRNRRNAAVHAIGLLFLLPGLASPLLAETQILEALVSADNALRENQGDRNQGSAASLEVRHGNTQRILLGFDPLAFAAIPEGAILVEAKLRIYFRRKGGNWGTDGLFLHRLTSAWTEMGSTWNCPIDANLSNNRPDCAVQWHGGQFVGSPIGSQPIPAGNGVWIEFDVASEIELLRTGLHQGFLLKKGQEGQSGWAEFTAREGSTAERAALRVTFEEPLPEDTTPPSLVFTSPVEERFVGEVAPPAELLLGDSGVGVDAASFHFEVDGTPWPAASCQVTVSSASCDLSALANGAHRLAAWVSDGAGNRSGATKDFELWIDREAPVVSFTSPVDGAWVTDPIVVVRGQVSDDASPIVRVSINRSLAKIEGNTFSAILSAEDIYPAPVTGVDDHPAVEIRAEAEDAAGRIATAAISVRVDIVPPSLNIWKPGTDARTAGGQVEILGTLSEAEPGDRVEIDGLEVQVDESGAFRGEVVLQEGVNLVPVRATDLAGNTSEKTLRILRARHVQIEITEPRDLDLLQSSTTTVRGQIGEAGVLVTVNGAAATVNGLSFEAVDVPLIEGGNLINVSAVNAAGDVGSDSVTVLRDTTAPHIAIGSPTTTYTDLEAIDVAGMINDLVAGTVDVADVVVKIAGRAAEVANRSFIARAVPLELGDNHLVIEATDQSGNFASATLDIRRVSKDRRRVQAVGGTHQYGPVFETLEEPLVVEVLGDDLQPVANQPVLWKVESGDGQLENGGHLQVTTTDAAGRASMSYRLGSRAGVGNQRIEAHVSGYRGPATFIPTALAGEPAALIVDAGDQQVGIAGGRLPRPLVLTVTDEGFNRLPGVMLMWTLTQGEGHFGDGSTTMSTMTDADGRAIVSELFLGPADGNSNNVVEVRLADRFDGPEAGFTASGWAVGLPQDTRLSGVVFDNSNQPVEGVTLRLRGLQATATTDGNGHFSMAPVPVGALQLIVDGSTANRPGSWPDLEFEIATVSGRDNDLGMPIFLLPLNQQDGVYVDETRGGILTMAEIPGFSLEIVPGSVTFPGGGRTGVVSVTAVHGDKIPMVPNFGQQPALIVTIQPAGARFDPPARLTLPNVESLMPGQSTELYSFDHDLGFFVSIGPGTVTSDGARILANEGVGVVKAGWHCGGNPWGVSTPHSCGQCKYATARACRLGCPPSARSLSESPPVGRLESLASAEESPTKCPFCDDNDPCTPVGRCAETGSCTPVPFKLFKDISGSCVATIGEPSAYSASTNNKDALEWQVEGSQPSSARGVTTFEALFTQRGPFTVEAKCGELARRKLVFSLPSCNLSETPTSKEDRSPFARDAAAFGEYNVWFNPRLRFVPCARGGRACTGLVTPKDSDGTSGGSLLWAVQTGPLTPHRAIPPQAELFPDDLKDPAKCKDVIIDLTSPGTYSGSGPLRLTYWVEEFTRLHENKHRTDADARVIAPFFEEIQRILPIACDSCSAKDCSDCDPLTLPDSVFQQIQFAFEEIVKEWNLDKEVIAHSVSNPKYDSLVSELKRLYPACRGDSE